MPKLPAPTLHEAERLAVLRAYEVLDTPPERAFDDLCSVAARLFRAPIALVSLVDECRQWFKARVGLAARETLREHAFCAHAIQSDQVLVVPDAHRDERFCDNPLVTGEPHIRFYAGAPLIASEGIRLGTLCVIDTVPREAGPEDLAALQALARQVVDQLEHRRVARQLADAVARTRALAGLLPVCMHCRRVREQDQSYHEQLEAWLVVNSGARITTALCPDCHDEHYGEY